MYGLALAFNVCCNCAIELKPAGNTWSDSGSVGEAITDEYITFTLVGGFVQVNVDIDGKAEANFTPTAMAVLTGVTAATDLNDNIVVG